MTNHESLSSHEPTPARASRPPRRPLPHQPLHWPLPPRRRRRRRGWLPQPGARPGHGAQGPAAPTVVQGQGLPRPPQDDAPTRAALYPDPQPLRGRDGMAGHDRRGRRGRPAPQGRVAAGPGGLQDNHGSEPLSLHPDLGPHGVQQRHHAGGVQVPDGCVLRCVYIYV